MGRCRKWGWKGPCNGSPLSEAYSGRAALAIADASASPSLQGPPSWDWVELGRSTEGPSCTSTLRRSEGWLESQVLQRSLPINFGGLPIEERCQTASFCVICLNSPVTIVQFLDNSDLDERWSIFSIIRSGKDGSVRCQILSAFWW